MERFPEIRTERLWLRRIVEEDIIYVHKGLSHPEVIRFYGVSYTTLEATTEQMEFYRKTLEDRSGIFWAICDRNTGEFMGVGGFYEYSEVHRKAEVGYWLLPEYWSKGFMTEGMGALVEYGFTRMHLHRIEGFVETPNIACRRAMDKLNFRHEGKLRDYERKNGEFISLEVYSLLESDLDLVKKYIRF